MRRTRVDVIFVSLPGEKRDPGTNRRATIVTLDPVSPISLLKTFSSLLPNVAPPSIENILSPRFSLPSRSAGPPGTIDCMVTGPKSSFCSST